MELCGWAMLVDCCILIYYAIIYQTVRRNDISFLRPHSHIFACCGDVLVASLASAASVIPFMPSTVNVLRHVYFIQVDFYYY